MTRIRIDTHKEIEIKCLTICSVKIRKTILICQLLLLKVTADTIFFSKKKKRLKASFELPTEM